MLEIWTAIKAARAYITLLAVAGAAAAIYAWGATGHQQARALESWVQVTCAAGGSRFEPTGALKGGSLIARGADCRARVERLAAFQRETIAGTADALTQAMTERDNKTNADAAAAARDAKAARAATERMETADEAVQGDRVGADWFGALNELGGLRSPR